MKRIITYDIPKLMEVIRKFENDPTAPPLYPNDFYHRKFKEDEAFREQRCFQPKCESFFIVGVSYNITI